MLSNPLFLHSMIRRSDSFLAVVDLLGLKAACDGVISALSLSFILLGIHAVRILLREESRIIGLRFYGGPFALLLKWF